MVAESNKPRIFVSHTASDGGLAHAFQEAVEGLSSKQVVVSHSSRKDSVGGVGSGADWLNWIGDEVAAAEVTVTLLTPASLAKPWLLWEIGAVYGAALAHGREDDRRLWPLLFKLEPDDLPDPLRVMNTQAKRGDDRADARQVLKDLFLLLRKRKMIDEECARDAIEGLDEALTAYLSAVNAAMRRAPIVPTEAVIQEWCVRLDESLRDGRATEVEHLRVWLDIAFGRNEQDKLRPIDARIHRRLGQLYIAGKKYKEAAHQFHLTSQLAPRDIFVLRVLGEARVKDRDFDAAKICLDEIEELDAEAFVRNADCAALKAKYFRATGDLPSATSTYEKALERSPTSYYLLDLLAQIRLTLGDLPGARDAYERALAALRESGERTLWANATRAAAALVTGAVDEIAVHLSFIAALRPPPDVVETIERTLRDTNRNLPEQRRVPVELLHVPSFSEVP